MSTAAELQTLLRFLSQDAKVPLASAMSKVKDLQKENLSKPTDIAQVKIETLTRIFGDEKVAKQVSNAAKRANKKRTSSDAAIESPTKKKIRPLDDPLSDPVAFEESVKLPEPCLDEEILSKTVLFTNRAPLVLAFAVVLLKYTMPEQPLSSRLSLAQAVVSANSRSKAVSLGLESGKSAEEEGYGEGQPTAKIMGREIRVMKRWGYDWKPKDAQTDQAASQNTQETLRSSEALAQGESNELALWGLDLEALKKSNNPQPPGFRGGSTTSMPIYTAQSARAYLLKSFDSQALSSESAKAASKVKAATSVATRKERNLGLLLGALELLYQSWAPTLGKEELDKRSWSWYVRVRPEVESGVAGWGGKNTIKLADILALKRAH